MVGVNNAQVPGYLFVWTNVDPAHEDDFNKWYDREHVEERIALPGFVSGIRYIAEDDSRRYLGLYRTSSLDAFRSEAYRQAFGHQTAWSVTNLGRMRDCMRRVCTVEAETGVGTGAVLAVLRLGRPAQAGDVEMLSRWGRDLQTVDGIIATRVLLPDVGLSSPLPAEKTEGRVLDPIFLVEATSEEAIRTALARPSREAPPAMSPAMLRVMWQLTEADLAAARTSESLEGLCR
ncbi:DUF4286 family protein [Telmatospirillum siberiense]|uniref:Uncharacterized protein n=1 Tax=Telmatospirillum siberiense TaxID=382514 RepID=A0A2N3PQQ3_9PROT|nr:DUF4286 family protein [Telmatospirillum siberiense]PKU22712.1 hypothetical protein CWS72_20515 [Telmatospirillum siberiense]